MSSAWFDRVCSNKRISRLANKPVLIYHRQLTRDMVGWKDGLSTHTDGSKTTRPRSGTLHFTLHRTHASYHPSPCYLANYQAHIAPYHMVVTEYEIGILESGRKTWALSICLNFAALILALSVIH